MWGWLSREKNAASFRNRRRASWSASEPGGQDLQRDVAPELLLPGALDLAMSRRRRPSMR